MKHMRDDMSYPEYNVNSGNGNKFQKPGRKTVYRSALSAQHYTTINNKLLQDERLSDETRGLICKLLSRPLDWEITVKGIISSGKAGRDKVYKMINEAKKYGYIQAENQTRTAQGKMATKSYIVSDDPEYLEKQYKTIAEYIQEDNPRTEKPDTVGYPYTSPPSTVPPLTAKRTQQKKESNKRKNLTKEYMVAPEISDTGTLPLFSSQDEACDLSPPKKSKKQVYSDRFEKFWTSYRKQCQDLTSRNRNMNCNAGNKREAWLEWQKLKQDTHTLAEKRLKAYGNDCARTGYNMKHACRYLKYETWESYGGSQAASNLEDRFAWLTRMEQMSTA